MPSHARSRWGRAGWIGAGALVLLGAVASPASAHSQLISMFPADGSSVSIPPARVVLTFDEDIQHIGDAIVVTAPDGTRVDDGAAVVEGPTASERLHPLTLRGHYAVSYRIVSDDGHPVTSTLGFDLVAGASTVASPGPANPAVSRGNAVRWPVVIVALALAGGLVWFMLPARRPDRTRDG